MVASSQLERAHTTALLLFHRCDVVDARLQERSAGRWEGRPRAELEASHPGALENDALRPDGFEEEHEVWQRALAALTELHRAAPRGLVAVVTHGALLRVVDRATGGDGDRFSHLEGLFLTATLQPSSRFSFTGLTA